MTIEFRCSQCNQLLRVPDTSAGKNARCPKCQSLMQVPSAEGSGASPPPLPPPFAASGSGGMPSFGPPPPASGAGDDPFSFLNKGGGGSSGGGATPPPAGPFGNAGAAPGFVPSKPAPSANPYASPAGAAYSYQPMAPGPGYGNRPGLPWEVKGQSVSTWWETAKLCMTQPTYAFSVMRQYGGMGQPMLYCGYGLAAGMIGQMLWYLPLMGIMGLMMNQGGNGQDAAMFVGIQVVSSIFQSVIGVLIGATLMLLIGAAILHVCLMLVGGARQGFETTLRVLGYAQGSIAWMNVIPIFGPLVGAIWGLVIEIIGVARAHEIETGKAVLAVFLPLIACCVLAGGLFALIMALGIAGANM
ncbi:MAG TPA: YIP1 family protein [Pirellulaceae bacterium]|nr:YIP1 family protein [Pirellulaceae bacterium]